MGRYFLIFLLLISLTGKVFGQQPSTGNQFITANIPHLDTCVHRVPLMFTGFDTARIISITVADTTVASLTNARIFPTTAQQYGASFPNGRFDPNGNLIIHKRGETDITITYLHPLLGYVDRDGITHLYNPPQLDGAGLTIHLKVGPPDTPTVKIRSISNGNCELDSYYVETKHAQVNAIYQWRINGVLSVTDSVFNNTTLKAGDMLTCSVGNPWVCQTDFVTDTVFVNRSVTPTISITSSVTQACQNSPVTLQPL